MTMATTTTKAAKPAAAKPQEMSEKSSQRAADVGVLQHPAWSVGDPAHQGDLTFVALDRLPKSAKVRKDRQLAIGNTQGSRHIVVGGEVYDADADELIEMIDKATNGRVKVSHPRYIGPVLAGPCVVQHPTHADHVFPDHAGTAVIYQRNLDAENREQRVQD